MSFEESRIQRAVFTWAKQVSSRCPELKLLYAIPNGANVSCSNRIRLVAEGLKKGIPDICLPVARGGYSSLYIELKTTKGYVSKDQREVILLLRKYGNHCVVTRGLSETIDAIESYLALKDSEQD